MIELRINENGLREYDRVQVAIDRFRLFEPIALSLNENGYYIADSGGKDSTVIKKLAELSGVKFEIVHNHTTIDHPETVYFVRREMKRYKDLGINYSISYPKISFWKLMRKNKRPPFRNRRYCCSFLKEVNGSGRFVVTGVRWLESVGRKNNRGLVEIQTSNKKNNLILMNDNDDARKEIETCPLKGKKILNPIIDWSDNDVWEFIKKYNLPYNPLYNNGYKRVGCVGCPLNSNNAHELDMNPKYKQMYIKTFDKLIQDRINSGEVPIFDNGLDYYNFWIGLTAKPDLNQVNFSDELEEVDAPKLVR